MKLLNYAAAIGGRAAPILICAAAVLAIGLTAQRIPETLAGGGTPVIELDMDISGGACATIQSDSAAAIGTKQIAVCLTSNPGGVPVAGFEYKLLYTDTIIQAPEVADVSPSLDDNPDANAGATTFSTPSLGDGWSCDGFGTGAHPEGDTNGVPGDGDGTAFSGGCFSAAGPNTLVTGPLGVVTFNVLSMDSVNVILSAVSVVDNDSFEIGSCDPVIDVAAICNNGSLNSAGGTATPVNTSTQTPTNTPVPTATLCPGGVVCQPTEIISNATDTPVPTATGQATEVPGETVPGTTPPAPGASPVGAGGPGGTLTGPDTGAGPGGGSGAPSSSLLLMAASGALFALAGAVLTWRRIRASVR